MKTPSIETVKSILRRQGISDFDCKSCYPENDAPANLQGKTHYVDPATLKGFECRILNAGHSKDNLLYWLVESVNSRPDHGGRNKRAVVFDVFGTVVNDRATSYDEEGHAGWHRKRQDAEKDAFDFIASFNAVKHTADALKARAVRAIAEGKETLAMLKSARKVATPAA